MQPEQFILLTAVACHEVNRAWCVAHGDDSQVPWSHAPEWQRASCIAGVKGALAGNNPEQSHELWLATKRADGWTYGETKDPEAKTHPCMVPYAELSAVQQQKDGLFVGTVREMAASIGYPYASVLGAAHTGSLRLVADREIELRRYCSIVVGHGE